MKGTITITFHHTSLRYTLWKIIFLQFDETVLQAASYLCDRTQNSWIGMFLVQQGNVTF